MRHDLQKIYQLYDNMKQYQPICAYICVIPYFHRDDNSLMLSWIHLIDDIYGQATQHQPWRTDVEENQRVTVIQACMSVAIQNLLVMYSFRDTCALYTYYPSIYVY